MTRDITPFTGLPRAKTPLAGPQPPKHEGQRSTGTEVQYATPNDVVQRGVTADTGSMSTFNPGVQIQPASVDNGTLGGHINSFLTALLAPNAQSETGSSAQEIASLAPHQEPAAPTTTGTTTGMTGTTGTGGNTPTITGGSVGAILATIRQMESGGNYQANNAKGGARGAYQFIDSTWRNAAKAAGVDPGKYPTASSAPPAVQDQVAAAYVQRILAANGGNVGAVPLTWYVGGVPSGAALDRVPAPQAGNTMTPRQYQQKWLAAYQKNVGK